MTSSCGKAGVRRRGAAQRALHTRGRPHPGSLSKLYVGRPSCSPHTVQYRLMILRVNRRQVGIEPRRQNLVAAERGAAAVTSVPSSVVSLSFPSIPRVPVSLATALLHTATFMSSPKRKAGCQYEKDPNRIPKPEMRYRVEEVRDGNDDEQHRARGAQ